MSDPKRRKIGLGERQPSQILKNTESLGTLLGSKNQIVNKKNGTKGPLHTVDDLHCCSPAAPLLMLPTVLAVIFLSTHPPLLGIAVTFLVFPSALECVLQSF